MLTHEKVQKFAQDWLDSWNSHDLSKIIAHYDENVEYFSFFSVKLTHNPDGVIYGKDKLKHYLEKGLQAYPDLHFKLIQVFTGVNSIVLLYHSVNNWIAAEVSEFNQNGLISPLFYSKTA